MTAKLSFSSVFNEVLSNIPKGKGKGKAQPVNLLFSRDTDNKQECSVENFCDLVKKYKKDHIENKELPRVSFGSDIEFNLPKKLFNKPTLVNARENDIVKEDVTPKISVNPASSFKTTAIYDHKQNKWLTIIKNSLWTSVNYVETSLPLFDLVIVMTVFKTHLLNY
ncbi:uncharacterized protein BX663DRAFT_265103 [Cokeromyces recurvatus]|uniref:uncharacterized protein n=1 Tax=Cokeromyces recurvatus TaxID=90255 RepID=UPI00221F54C4|nr:uncharacterized protein BX663DRAFT_265103 [Cokeromyces recurvatus]KAI7898193.1 hypothetical protein BX663DRAFT_265103 [Cokeromyces recurvatus]